MTKADLDNGVARESMIGGLKGIEVRMRRLWEKFDLIPGPTPEGEGRLSWVPGEIGLKKERVHLLEEMLHFIVQSCGGSLLAFHSAGILHAQRALLVGFRMTVKRVARGVQNDGQENGASLPMAVSLVSRKYVV